MPSEERIPAVLILQELDIGPGPLQNMSHRKSDEVMRGCLRMSPEMMIQILQRCPQAYDTDWPMPHGVLSLGQSLASASTVRNFTRRARGSSPEEFFGEELSVALRQLPRHQCVMTGSAGALSPGHHGELKVMAHGS